MLLRKYLLGMHIKNFITDNLERVIIIEFEGFDEIDDLVSLKLVVELMGKHSNILLLDETSHIIDCIRHIYAENTNNFKTRNLIPKYKYVFPISEKNNFLDITNFDDFYAIVQQTSNLSLNRLPTFLVDIFNGFSKVFIENSIEYLDIKSINEENLRKLYSYISEIVNTTNTSFLTFKTIYDSNQKVINYALEMINEKNKDSETENTNQSDILKNFSLNLYLDDFYYSKNTSERLITYRNSLLKFILDILKKYQKRLKHMNEKLKECDNMETYKVYGELIIANLYKIPNENVENITIENYYDNNNLITIPLDKKFTPNMNAKRFFKKYNKLKNALQIVTKQKEETLKELNYIESIIYELENCNSLEEVSNIYEEISESLIFRDSLPNSLSQNSKNKKIKKSNLTKNKTATFNPIKYIIDGYTVLAGRNNKENDYLTLKYANKNDIWFHTQLIHGSHVILKVENSIPSQETLIKVASIAALHSKAKNSSNVPVDYCEVKYVKKPNNSKPGMVIYTHQPTLIVNPFSKN